MRKQRPRRVLFTVRQEVFIQLREMQHAGVIQPSHSPWASLVIWSINMMELTGFVLITVNLMQQQNQTHFLYPREMSY